MIIHWPQVIVVTVTLYALIILSLPFNTVYATMFLFALIAYWSRLPGVGIPSPFFILYLADLVDLLAVIIAINVGPLEGALFSAFGNFGSRLAGVFPKWWSVNRDSMFQFVICLFIPWIHEWGGADLEITMFWFTMIRRFMFIPVYMIYKDIPLPNFIILWCGATASSVLINIFYARYFGWFFDGIIQIGVEFNWMLFILATFIMILGKIFFFGKSNVKWLDQRYLLKRILKKSLTKRISTKKILVNDTAFVREIKKII
ncbi:MAG: hypothetical protein ACMXYG_03625 [Candidatus Woesearchaeota archaeon]